MESNKQTELTSRIESDSESRLRTECGGGGIEQKRKKERERIHGQVDQYGDYRVVAEVGGGRRGYRG